ncbi:MAG: hypothetical protein OQL16_12190 [Gammaproteobacteria bacterium]|nr:hypothetical protein [Gammaproteobacteria bacterium]
MDTFFISYLILWLALCALAIALSVTNRSKLSFSCSGYWPFLFVHWKWITFVIATTGMTVIAPYTGDPTWDYFDALFMSILTYITAPWAIGTIYQGMRGRQPLVLVYIAACAWLFTASWSYDLYILLRDGEYPHTWWSNMMLSSILYVCAGLMWNLEYWPDTGVKFAFMRHDWPRKIPEDNFLRIFLFALPFMILVAALILAFVIPVPGLSM